MTDHLPECPVEKRLRSGKTVGSHASPSTLVDAQSLLIPFDGFDQGCVFAFAE